MLRNLNNFQLLLVLAGLIALIGAIKVVDELTAPPEINAASFDIDLNRLHSMTIHNRSRPDADIRVEKREGSSWNLVVNDSTVIDVKDGPLDTLLGYVYYARRARLISSSPQNWEEMGVTPEGNSIVLGDSSGNEIFHLIIGYPFLHGGGGSEMIVREANNDTSYTVLGSLKIVNDLTLDKIVDTSLLNTSGQ